MQYKITAPVADHTGRVAGVAFADGVATIDGDTQHQALAYFRRKGYGVAEVRRGKDVEVEQVQAPADAAPGTANGSDADEPPHATAEAVEEAKAAQARQADEPPTEPARTAARRGSKGDAK